MTYTRKPARKKKATSSGTWSKPTVYRGIQYRSRWEVLVAKLLLYSGIEFKYEPRRFFLSPKVSYLPDFYIPELQAYIEVKGWLLDKDKVKIAMFQAKVTSRFIYLGKEELEVIFGDSAAKISKLDFDTYVPSSGEIIRFRQAINNSLRGKK